MQPKFDVGDEVVLSEKFYQFDVSHKSWSIERDYYNSPFEIIDNSYKEGWVSIRSKSSGAIFTAKGEWLDLITPRSDIEDWV